MQGSNEKGPVGVFGSIPFYLSPRPRENGAQLQFHQSEGDKTPAQVLFTAMTLGMILQPLLGTVNPAIHGRQESVGLILAVLVSGAICIP